ncbi:MAG: NAD(P)H-hydrate epimerase, partial [Chloroflexi bacterium]|nr:NAD(P)H-hydrate epimerase [Chloroflexota bacterium]
MKLLTSAEMRELEQRAESASVSTDTLMENAGLAVAQEIWMQLGSLEDRRIAVLVGPGNNGGDGLVAARHLHEWGAQVRVYALRERSDAQWTQTVEQGVPCGAASDDEDFEALEALLSGAEAIVDALLGTGSSRQIEGDLAEIMQRLAAVRERTVKPKLVAVDLPTGLDADSGRLDPLAVAADETVTFHAPKVGLYMQPGAGAAGSVQHVDIGIPPGLDDDLQTEVLERRAARALLPVRAPDAHKGTFGRVLVIAGSTRYPGAALLAARGAYRAGAG